MQVTLLILGCVGRVVGFVQSVFKVPQTMLSAVRAIMYELATFQLV